MHGYSTDSDEKRVVPLILAGLAIALAWMSSNLLATEHFSMPWWMDAPSSVFFYGRSMLFSISVSGGTR
jgi:uncharacterized membrane protein